MQLTVEEIEKADKQIQTRTQNDIKAGIEEAFNVAQVSRKYRAGTITYDEFGKEQFSSSRYLEHSDVAFDIGLLLGIQIGENRNTEKGQ